ncbi:hypothetical protein PR048_007898 [Dryococelus australis]|uniref:Uncharacterized protein n=1 Tax=Dryococelus australis TaxID=614101 RepID=A0ABQ9HVK1_9NEOP|nr:hypothetical protein PR048_007898 [Dryococelus australis]
MMMIVRGIEADLPFNEHAFYMDLAFSRWFSVHMAFVPTHAWLLQWEMFPKQPRGIEHEVRAIRTAARGPPSMPDESPSSREMCYCDETLVWSSAGMKRRVDTADNRENPPTSGIVRHDSHMNRSGIEPGSHWWEASRLTAQPPRPPKDRNNSITHIRRIRKYCRDGAGHLGVELRLCMGSGNYLNPLLILARFHLAASAPIVGVARAPTINKDVASHQGEPGSIPSRATGFSQVGIVPPLHSGAAPYSLKSPSSALKTLLLRAAQISSLTLSIGSKGSIVSYGGRAVRQLSSHRGKPGSITAGSLRIFASGNRARRCRWSWVFSGMSHFPRPFIPALLPFSPHSNRIGSQYLAVKNSPNLFTSRAHQLARPPRNISAMVHHAQYLPYELPYDNPRHLTVFISERDDNRYFSTNWDDDPLHLPRIKVACSWRGPSRYNNLKWNFSGPVGRAIPSGDAVAQWLETSHRPSDQSDSKWGRSGSVDRNISSGAAVTRWLERTQPARYASARGLLNQGEMFSGARLIPARCSGLQQSTVPPPPPPRLSGSHKNHPPSPAVRQERAGAHRRARNAPSPGVPGVNPELWRPQRPAALEFPGLPKGFSVGGLRESTDTLANGSETVNEQINNVLENSIWCETPTCCNQSPYTAWRGFKEDLYMFLEDLPPRGLYANPQSINSGCWRSVTNKSP